MKAARRAVTSLLFAIAMLASLFATSAPAQATSDYDNVIHATPALEVYTDGSTKSQTMDISATWWTEFKEAYALRIAQNIGWPTNFVSTFEDYVSSGGSWGVSVTETQHGNVISFGATDDPNATCSFGGSGEGAYYGCLTDPGYGVVRSYYFAHNSYGNNGCWSVNGYHCSTNGMGIYGAPEVLAPASYGYYVTVISANSNTESFIMNYNHNYPTGYEGEFMPTTRHVGTSEYVAMGDSYSSGEGNSPYETLTDMKGLNECHRSLAHSYSHVISQDTELDLEGMEFVACSGATTDSLLNGGSAETAQTNALSISTNVVTLTIGGNDLGFKEVLEECANTPSDTGWGCSSSTGLNGNLEDRIEALNGTALTTVNGPDGGEIYSILEVIEAINIEAPNASIYIAGYPRLFGSSLGYFEPDQEAPGGGYCKAGVGVNFSYQDAQWMNEWADSINQVISEAVTVAQNEQIDVTFVTANGFNGYGLCDTNTPFLHDVMLDSISIPPGVNRGSMHPNEMGMYVGYGVQFQYAMN